MRYLTRVAVSAALTWFGAQSASAETDWTEVDCSKAALRTVQVSALKCKVSNDISTGNALTRQNYVSNAGWSSQIYVNLTLFATNGTYRVYGADESEKYIRAFVLRPEKNAINWGAYKGFGDTGYITFNAGKYHCVGVDHGGARTQSNIGSGVYRYVLRGYFCDKSGSFDAEALVRGVLGSMVVTVDGRSANPFGQPALMFARLQP